MRGLLLLMGVVVALAVFVNEAECRACLDQEPPNYEVEEDSQPEEDIPPEEQSAEIKSLLDVLTKTINPYPYNPPHVGGSGGGGINVAPEFKCAEGERRAPDAKCRKVFYGGLRVEDFPKPLPAPGKP